jgi:hypothetical protein
MERTISVEQFVKECFCKCAHIIASSRCPASTAVATEAKSQRWVRVCCLPTAWLLRESLTHHCIISQFQLSVNEHQSITSQLAAWRRSQAQCMVIEVSPWLHTLPCPERLLMRTVCVYSQVTAVHLGTCDGPSLVSRQPAHCRRCVQVTSQLNSGF